MLLVLASNMLLICPCYGTPEVLAELWSHEPHTCLTTGFRKKTTVQNTLTPSPQQTLSSILGREEQVYLK